MWFSMLQHWLRVRISCDCLTCFNSHLKDPESLFWFAIFALGSKCMNSPGHVATDMLPRTRDMGKRWSRGSQRTALFVSVIVAAMNGSNAEVVSCTELPTFPGGCNPDAVVGACFSTEANVNWACGAWPNTDCRRVRLPPGQTHRPNLRRNYDGYCSFSETATKTSSTATSITTTLTSSLTSTTSSTLTMTTTLPHAPLGSPVARHGHLRVVGNQIVGEHNHSVRLRGMSLFWSQWGGSYWNEETLRWLRRDWGIELIRAAMGVEPGAYLEHPKREMRKVKRVVRAAHQLGIYVIVDWHDHHANLHTRQAERFFNEIAKSYGHLPNVLFETFNEPTWQSWSREVKPYHEKVLKVIRRHSPNIVIAGTPTWSQDVDIASAERVVGANIAYTLHFYAATHGQFLRDKAKRALDRGVALFVSEWGTCEANGNGGLNFEESQKWMDFLAEYNVSDANWAVNDKKESCSALRPGAATNGHWRRKELTPSGRWVRHSIRLDTIQRNSSNSTNGTNGTGTSDSPDLMSTSEADRRLHFWDVDLPIDAGVRCQAAAMIGLGLLHLLWAPSEDAVHRLDRDQATTSCNIALAEGTYRFSSLAAQALKPLWRIRLPFLVFCAFWRKNCFSALAFENSIQSWHPAQHLLSMRAAICATFFLHGDTLVRGESEV